MSLDECFAQRRHTVLQQMDSSGVAVLAASTLKTRNSDVSYPFRQNSNFYYLTGLSQPEAVLVLLPNRAEGETVLFCPKEDPERDLWEGPQVGPQLACAEYGADQAFEINTLFERLIELLSDRSVLYFDLGGRLDQVVVEAINKVKQKQRKGIRAPQQIQSIAALLAEMRCVKAPYEQALIRQACQISVDGHRQAMQLCQPGLTEYQLEASLVHSFMIQGARSVAYPSIVGGGRNACTLHYIDNRDLLREGDLVLIDAGAEWQGYAGDITRTFPVSGRFSAAQTLLYELVLATQLSVIELVKPGLPWGELQTVAIKRLTQGLLDLGILKGGLDEMIETKAYRKYYMHNIGHWLGLDVHDVGAYKVENQWRALQPGMVFTVEPGLYIPEEADVPEQWQGIGIRIEDDILVTDSGCEILTQALPKNIADIEALMRADAD